MAYEYEVIILSTAKSDMSDMIDTLIEDYPDAALRKYDKIMDAAKRLRDTPYMYEEYAYRKPYRRIVVEDYQVFYIVEEEQKTVKIYRVLYERRNINL